MAILTFVFGLLGGVMALLIFVYMLREWKKLLVLIVTRPRFFCLFLVIIFAEFAIILFVWHNFLAILAFEFVLFAVPFVLLLSVYILRKLNERRVRTVTRVRIWLERLDRFISLKRLGLIWVVVLMVFAFEDKLAFSVSVFFETAYYAVMGNFCVHLIWLDCNPRPLSQIRRERELLNRRVVHSTHEQSERRPGDECRFRLDPDGRFRDATSSPEELSPSHLMRPTGLECPLCIQDMTSWEQICVTECKHAFHTGCLRRVFLSSNLGCPLCPMCRHPLRGAHVLEAGTSRQNLVGRYSSLSR